MTDELPNTDQPENLIDPLAERIRDAWADIKGGRERWINGTLKLAAAIADSRKQYLDHNAFSLWLERHGLQKMTKDTRWAFLGIASVDQAAMRQELEKSHSTSWEVIWRKSRLRPLRKIPKGGPRRFSRGSGHADRKRAARIPTVMQERPVRPVVAIVGKTREEVDPDFEGDAIEFAAKYGPVTLHTKAEIEESKRQDVLQKWLGAVASHVRTAEALLACALPDLETLAAWMKTPSKAAKLRAWRELLIEAQSLVGAGDEETVRRALDTLAASGLTIQPLQEPEALTDECPDHHSLND